MHVIADLDAGGAETMLAALATADAADGNAPIVVSLTGGGVLAGRLSANAVPVFDLGMRRGSPNPLGVLRLARLIRRFQPPTVLGWMYHANLVTTAALMLSGRYRNTAQYWGIRCSDMDLSAYGGWFRVVVKANARLSRFPDAVVYNSEAGIAVHEALGFRPRRTLLIDNGIDTLRFRPNAEIRSRVRATLGIDREAPVVAVVARMDPMKDYPTLLSALERVPEAIAVVMGAGTDQRLPQRDGLVRLGRRDDIPDILAAADMIVSPSAYGEGFSNALAEGMACGLVPVATDVGDAKRIVGDTGMIVPPRDPEALATAMRSLLHAADRTEKGHAARKRIEDHFSLNRSVERFHRLYADGLHGDERPV